MENIYPIGDDYPLTPEMDLILRIVSQWGNAVEMPNMEDWLKEYAVATREKKYLTEDIYPGSSYQPLFDLMHQEHGLTLLESEMNDIIHVVREMEGPIGAVWVKASEFRTTVPIYRPYRKRIMEDEGEYYYGQIYVAEDDGHIYLNIDNESNFEIQSDAKWDSYEILDESATHWRPLPEPPKQS